MYIASLVRSVIALHNLVNNKIKYGHPASLVCCCCCCCCGTVYLLTLPLSLSSPLTPLCPLVSLLVLSSPRPRRFKDTDEVDDAVADAEPAADSKSDDASDDKAESTDKDKDSPAAGGAGGGAGAGSK